MVDATTDEGHHPLPSNVLPTPFSFVRVLSQGKVYCLERSGTKLARRRWNINEPWADANRKMDITLTISTTRQGVLTGAMTRPFSLGMNGASTAGCSAEATIICHGGLAGYVASKSVAGHRAEAQTIFFFLLFLLLSSNNSAGKKDISIYGWLSSRWYGKHPSPQAEVVILIETIPNVFAFLISRCIAHRGCRSFLRNSLLRRVLLGNTWPRKKGWGLLEPISKLARNG